MRNWQLAAMASSELQAMGNRKLGFQKECFLSVRMCQRQVHMKPCWGADPEYWGRVISRSWRNRVLGAYLGSTPWEALLFPQPAISFFIFITHQKSDCAYHFGRVPRAIVTSKLTSILTIKYKAYHKAYTEMCSQRYMLTNQANTLRTAELIRVGP